MDVVCSTIGGYAPGHLIGPAFNSSYILAKTENTDSETPIEEDNWIAAMEWADSIGVGCYFNFSWLHWL